MIVAPQDELVTVEHRRVPPQLPVRLQALLYVHARVSSHRWQARHDSPDGTVHRFHDGPVMRVRTEDLTPVPPAAGPVVRAFPQLYVHLERTRP